MILKRTVSVSLFLCTVFCSHLLPPGSQNLTAANSSNTKSSYGGTIVIGVANEIDSFNPLFNESSTAQEVTHLMLLGLANLNEKSEFTPELASSWKSSADHLELTYTLRKDALWSDGVPVTAEDVKFTFDLLMDSTVASPRQGSTEYIEKVEVQDPQTVTFYFSKA
ncbi:MAG: ABC transporter substrate-binding protein, partial [bacterium]